MKSKSSILGISLPVFIVVLIGAVTLRTVSAINFYHQGYFTNAVITNIGNAAVVLSSVFFLIYIWTSKKEINLIPSFASPANYVPSAAVGAALLMMVLNMISVFTKTSTPIKKWLALATVIFGVLSVIYFLLNTLFIRSVSLRRANFGLCVIAFFVIYIAYIYFDKGLPMNAHTKITDQMAYLFTAVFFLYETRLSLGREKWKHYIVFGFIASLITAYSSIPALIAYFVSGISLSISIYESVLTFTLFIFITSKLLLTSALMEKVESPIVKNLIEAARKRDELLKNAPTESEYPVETESEEADENQISIAEIDDTSEESGDEEQSNGSELQNQEKTSQPDQINTEDEEASNEENTSN